VNPCCADFGRYYTREPRELHQPGIHIWRHMKEPPHYDPPRYFLLLFRPPEGNGVSVQISFCPFCGKDLNALWKENIR